MSEQSYGSGSDLPGTGVEGDSDVTTTGADDAAADRLAAGADAPELDDDSVDSSGVDISGPSHALTDPTDLGRTDDGEAVGRSDAEADRDRATPADGDEE